MRVKVDVRSYGMSAVEYEIIKAAAVAIISTASSSALIANIMQKRNNARKQAKRIIVFAGESYASGRNL